LLRYLGIRLLEGILVVLGVVTIVFFVTRLLGDPTLLLVPQGASAADLAQFRRALGLDSPVYVQYLRFLGEAASGNFGTSFVQHRAAVAVVVERLPATLQLTGASMLVGTVIGGVLGILAAVYRGRPFASVIMLPALFGQAVPSFWLGLMAIEIFAVSLNWLPTGGSGSFAQLLLPALTLSTFTAASIARLLRSSLVEVLNEEFILAARSKGLAGSVILFRHALRNAIIPAVTMLGVLAGELLGGALVTEVIFSWPGVGQAVVSAIQMNDFPVVQAGVTVSASIFVLLNILVDMLYAVLDPRIRLTR